MKLFVGLFIGLFLCSCSPKDPLAKLGEEHKVFLFGDDESNIAFMGKPSSGDNLSCDPRAMTQGYLFKIEEKRVIIESVRPSGTVQHIIKTINDGPATINIKAMNGANIPFGMQFNNLSENGAAISQDGEPASDFIRCIK